MISRARLAALGCTAAILGLAAPAAAAEPEAMRLNLTYDGRLYVKVLEVAVEQVLEPKHFVASAHIKTSGLLALFRRINLRADSEGRVERGVVLPGTFSYLNTDGRKNRRVSATWSATDVAARSEPQYPTMGDPPATREQKLEASDPLTVLTRITLLPAGDKPCQGVSQFFDGKQRYDVEYSYRGTAKPDDRERRLGLIDEVRCGLTYREVAGFKKKPPEQRGQGLHREVTLGLGRLGPNGPWVISFLHADTFLGPADIDLTSVHVSGARPG